MRTIIIGLFLLIFFIISIPLFLLEIIIGKFSKKAKVSSSQAIVSRAFQIILFLSGVKKTVIGLDNIPKDEAVLFVSNHRSYYDIVTAYATIPTLTGFVAKKEINKIPFLRVWMRYLNCLFLDRANPREGLKTILAGIENIKSGYSMFIAPEGTRNQDDTMLPFKEGSLKMAEKTGCAIIPVTINNTDKVFETQAPWVKRANISIEYGAPIYPKTLSKEEQKFLGAYVQNIIKETYEKNKYLV